MSQKNNKNRDVLEKEQRYKLVPYLFIIIITSILLNMVLWKVDIAAILFFTISLVITKMILVAFRIFNFDKWKSRRITFLSFLTFILLVSFGFDVQRIQDLWIYRFGEETQGQVIRFDKTKEVIVVYEYSANGAIFQKAREVSVSFYERLNVGSQVRVKYFQDNPNFSYLVDLEQQKSLTLFTFILGFAVMTIMFANEILEMVNLFFRNNYRA